MNFIKQIDENELNYLSYNQIIRVLAELNHLTTDEVKREIDKLLQKGELINTSKKKLATKKKVGLLEGTISLTRAGYGFFIPDDKSIPDIFIPEEFLNGAFHNDRVVVQKSFNRNGDMIDGKVVSVLSHTINVCVGKVESKTSTFSIIAPDNKKLNKVFVRNEYMLDAKKGDKVVVKLTKFNEKRLEGRVIEVLISDNPINVDVLSIVREFELYEEFPKEVLLAADKVKKEVTEEDIKGREDLRNLNTFTIDGEDARDFDDAISITKNADGTYLLGVHIADVGEYVPYESILDREAFKRGTSTYFPNAVFPMLPKQLSNDICSLNEKVDRLTLSCLMKIDKNGAVLEHKICEAVINSKARMTYTKVAKILEGDKELRKQYDFLVNDLEIMRELNTILEDVRKKRGALDFEIPEPKIILNDQLEIEKFEARPNTIADRIIESFMLIANETVAKEFKDRKIPFVFRVHERPNCEKLEAFNEFASAMGYSLNGDLENLPSKKLQKFIDGIDEEKKTVINKVLLRSMQKAKYSDSCLGHYGLGAEYYCHFTSPIRRYPDLTIHRIIKDFLHGKLNTPLSIEKLNNFVKDSANQSSLRETISDKAENMVDDYFKARYMLNKKGEVFDGIISGVVERGIFVELDNTCEGFIPVENLPDKIYTFFDTKYTLQGSSTKFMLGDKIRIKVDNVDLNERRVNFLFVETKKFQKKIIEEKNLWNWYNKTKKLILIILLKTLICAVLS